MELRFGSTRLWILGLLVALAGLAWLFAEPARANLPISGGQLCVRPQQLRALGNSTNDRTYAPNPTPTLVALPGATGWVTQVAAGGHTLAVTTTGQLYAFGSNTYGQLGNTNNNGTATPNPNPTLVTLPGATGPVVDVAVGGGQHSLAVTSTGQLYAFGDNQSGQLGTTTSNGTTNPNPAPTLVTLPGATGGVVGVAAGYAHSLAVTNTRQLYGFGDNTSGSSGAPPTTAPITQTPLRRW